MKLSEYEELGRRNEETYQDPPPIIVKRKRRITYYGIVSGFVKWSITLCFMLVFVAAGVALGAYIGIIQNAPALPTITVAGDIQNSTVYDSNGNVIDHFKGEENRQYTTLDRIPVYLRNAVVAVEDSRFYEHDGIDYKGMTRAVWVTAQSLLKGSHRMEGASTITQQLIKNQFIKDGTIKSRRNNVITKLQEQYLAVKYEEKLIEQLGDKKSAKDYILELYLNTIGLHHGYEGVQQAAKGYFGKNTEELNLAECACIAGITNNPTLYSPRTQPENNKKRTKKILDDMLEQGYITPAEHDEALNDDIYSRIVSSDAASDDEISSMSIHSFFVDSVFEQVSRDLQEKHNMTPATASNLIYNGGLQILTTFDPEVQTVLDKYFIDINNPVFPSATYNFSVIYNISVEDSVTKKQKHSEFKQYVRHRDDAAAFAAQKRAEIEAGLSSTETILSDRTTITVQPQSAMVIMDYRTGQVKGIAGGRGEKNVNRGLNRAVDSTRQPGSVFKVLASFAPGIDLGIVTPATVVEDEPYSTKDGYTPQNWYKGYRGPSTIRLGITNSMNIVAVKTMVELVGIDRCYEYLLNFGFTTLENDNHASTALGGITYGVTQLEVTAAYAAIANGGVYNKPTFYTKVLDKDGNVLLEYTPEQHQVLKKTSAFLVTDMMRDVVTKGTGTECKFRSINVPVSGKTGTTQNSRDLTFVGFTPYYAAGVWLGYDDYDNTVRNMENMSQTAHETLWRKVMEEIHIQKGLTSGNFEQPEGVVKKTVCQKTGLLAGKGCPAYDEYFDASNYPTKYCGKYHSSSDGSTSSGSSNRNSSSSSDDDDDDENDEDKKEEENDSNNKPASTVASSESSDSGNSDYTEPAPSTPADTGNNGNSTSEPEAPAEQPADTNIESSNDPVLGSTIPAVPDDVAQSAPEQTPEANAPPEDSGPVIE